MRYSSSNKNWLSDDLLLEKFQKTANKELIGILFKRYTHLVMGVCMKYMKNTYICEDTLMDIFQNLLLTLNQKKIENFKSWLFIVTKNHCLMVLRKKQKEIYVEQNEIQNYSENFMENQQDLHLTKENENKKIENIKNAIKKLSPQQKECIELFFLENKSYIEIVEITGYQLKKVKSYIQNGKRNLKLMIKGK